MKRIGSLLPLGTGDPVTHRGARRRSVRFPLHAEVEVLEPVKAGGVALNVSAGGLRIAIDRCLPGDKPVLIKVCLPQGRFSVERARVVWLRKLSDGCVAGLEFLDIDWFIPVESDLTNAA